MKSLWLPGKNWMCGGLDGPSAGLASPESSNPQLPLQLEPSPEEAEQLAMQTALENRKKTVAEKPDCALAWHRYGEALLVLNRPEEAVPALRQAAALSPDTLLFHHDLGLALADLNQIPAAKAEFASIVATDPQLKCAGSSLMLAAITNLALSQEKLGERDEAIQTLLPALDTAVGILFNLGFLHFRARRFDTALPYAHAAYVLKPNNEDVVHQYGAILSELKRFGEAINILKQATELNPFCCGAWYDLGLAYARQNKRKQARVYFLKARQVEPRNPWPHYDLACLDALDGKRDAAFRNLWKAVERGFRDVGYLRRDKDFRCLRRVARWKELIATISDMRNSNN